MILILDNIRSAFNVGSIFRIADAAGAEVYVCGISPTPDHSKVAKTALGAEQNVEWKKFDSVEAAIKAAKQNDCKVYAVETDPSAKSIYKTKFPAKTAFIFGHEVSGVSDQARKLSDKIVKIPMHGKKRSLNVAVSAGITAYEALRQWAESQERKNKQRI